MEHALRGCRNVTDRGIEILRGLHMLDDSYQATITDKAFENLRGIHTLSMGSFDAGKSTITDSLTRRSRTCEG